MHLYAYKHDGKPHYKVPAEILHAEGNHSIALGPWQRKLEHYTRNLTIHVENHCLEFYWSDRWYSIGFDLDKEGKLLMVYCNIAKPAEFKEDGIHLIDMDLDVTFGTDLNPTLVDQEEFIENRDKYGYTQEEMAECLRAVGEVVALAEEGQYPFDGTWQRTAKDLGLRKE